MYTTLDDLIRFSGLTWKPELNSTGEKLIASAQRYVENYCGDERFGARIFRLEPDMQTETRYFDGNGKKRLYVGDIQNVETVSIGSVVQSGYFLYPPATQNSSHNSIELSQAEGLAVFPFGQQNVAITSYFIYSAVVPPDIELAVLKLATGMIKQHTDIDVKEVTSESLGDYRATYQSLDKIVDSIGIKELLKPYVRSPEEGADDDTPKATIGLRKI